MSNAAEARNEGGMMMPLDGLRVIDASSLLAGPLCCQILGDFGADVIKIEHPTRGDGLRGHGAEKKGVTIVWKEVNRNKRAIAVDLSAAEGAEILLRLATDADVVVENFRPGTFERWGLGPDVLRERNPSLVLARITGFGQTGPYASRPGFGTLAEAMSGFADMTGETEGPPTLPPFGLADTICAIAASSAVLMALRHRDQQGGGGQVIDMNLLTPIMAAVGPLPTVYQQLGVVEHRHGNRSTITAPRNLYRTSDGSWVAVSTSALSIAQRVMRLVGHPEVIDEPWFRTSSGRVEHVELLDRYVSDWVADRTREEVLADFEKVGAAAGAVYDTADIVHDPHIRATEMLTIVDDDDLGDILMHNVMWRMSTTPGRIRFTGRALGADTDAVLLEELGYTEGQVRDMRQRGVVA